MNKKGFTLIEILAVIAILAVLVTLVVPRVINYYHKSKKDMFLNEVGKLYTCLLYTSPSPRDYLPSRMPSSA